MARTHIDPGQALDALALLGARSMLPIHFDTFINSEDLPGECPAELRRQMGYRALGSDRVAILAAGEQRVFVSR
jgi:L-ascorbate metabolism protein UlaG (beta-lactamase superfamily)